jgi:hypothetical protein
MSPKIFAWLDGGSPVTPFWTLVAEVLGALASIAVILDYFGIKPNSEVWGSIMALSQKRKLVIMLFLVGLMLWFSGYGFYRSLKPKIVERIVEKPVEKIEEKTVLVPQECPKTTEAKRDKPRGATTTTTARPSPPQQLDCGGGNCAMSTGQQGGITAGQIELTTAPPLPHVSWEPADKKIFTTKATHPVTEFYLWTNGLFQDPAFVAMCDRPCKALAFSNTGFNQNCELTPHGGNEDEDAKLAMFLIEIPNPFPGNLRASVAVESQDDSPVKILDVRSLTFGANKRPVCNTQ